MHQSPLIPKVSLDKILKPHQLQRVMEILSNNADVLEKAVMLKRYFDKIEKQLLSKGFMPHYLAYAVIAHIPEILTELRTDNNDPKN